jgi:hypothetical protein
MTWLLDFDPRGFRKSHKVQVDRYAREPIVKEGQHLVVSDRAQRLLLELLDDNLRQDRIRDYAQFLNEPFAMLLSDGSSDVNNVGKLP